MKCVKNGGVVKRVTERSAVLLTNQGWLYAPKSEWKALKKGKTAPSQDEVVVEDVKVVKKDKNKKVKKNKLEDVDITPAPKVNPVQDGFPFGINPAVVPEVPKVPKVVKKAKKKISIEV